MKQNKMRKILPVLILVLTGIVAINQYTLMTMPAGKSVQKMVQRGAIEYSESGYQQLLQYDRTIKLDSLQMKNYAGLDVELPCCGFAKLQATGNCGCGHHAALSGLAKFMASEGFSKDKIQGEIDTWKGVFFNDNIGSDAMGGC